MSYDWPGNVRELENAIERAVVLTTGPIVEPRNLPPNVRPTLRPAGMPPIPGSSLAEIVGAGSSEDTLDYIFSHFCIGK